MMQWAKLIQAAVFCAVLMGAAFASSSVHDVKEGVSAYRAGDDETAWRLLKPAAEEGETKAQRYLAYMLLDGRTPARDTADLFAGVALLKQAAAAGDYAALIRLEDLRRQRLAHSPSLADMIAIERRRAEAGDPVSAWRLAGRYETGDGVPVSEAHRAKWLEIAASVDSARFPKAREAAFRLCEMKALGEDREPDAARRWCAMAAEDGHAGAAIVLRRLAQIHY